jgi:hypothetical protein
MPTFESLEQEREYRKAHLALVFRALHREGMAEGVAGESVARVIHRVLPVLSMPKPTPLLIFFHCTSSSR